MLGERLGKWVIFKELGRGGMGQVYLAQEEIGGRQAALKILSGELAQEVGFLQRFQREIETLSQLSHPNIVQFYEAGYENSMYFYAMEYVEGQSLEEILHAQGRLPWPDVLDLAQQVAHALRHVHDHGIIHRDIKPPNLLRTSEGQIKLMDFGIAKVFAQAHLTATGGVVGTAEYLSPEQAAGKPVSKRSDLYSLGVVLYTLLTGKTPFEGTTFLDLLHKHRYAQFDRPQRLVPDLPYEIDDLVCQLLEKDPAKRPPDCLVLGKQVERLRNKLERKSHPTEEGMQAQATVAEHRASPSLEDFPGPGTLMSRLMRAELDRQNRAGWLGRLLNRAWVLAVLLGLCVAAIAWAFWPANAQTLFENGSRLMASTRPGDWERAWRDYLQPLEDRFSDHPYQEELVRFREKLDAHRRGVPPIPSEAQRFFKQGERLREEGQWQAARKVWENVVLVFEDVEADKEWVRKSEEALQTLDQQIQAKERWQTVRPALKRAAALRAAGKREEAEKIWSALESLYRDDPAASAILAEIRKARKP